MFASTVLPATTSALIRDLDAVMAHPLASRPALAAAALRPYLGQSRLLGHHHRRSSAEGYRTNIVHVDPAGTYSVVALVWRPGQRTPIHSHASWCVVGIHQGREVERSFRRCGAGVVETGRRTMSAGDVAWLEADDDIHDVANADDGTTISIHVYGLDYRITGSSIAGTFRADPAAATAA
jgi:3-mercaptopropionate dioxygenase